MLLHKGIELDFLTHGLLNLSFGELVLATLLFTHVTIIAVTIFLHRAQAHRALDLHPVISHCFRFWLWLTTGMVTRQWVAIHRKHHAKCETADDPHSPQILGIRRVLWEGVELYRAEASKLETLDRYGYGTPDDWLERHIYSCHHQLGVTFLLLLNLTLFGAPGLTIWSVQLLWIPFWAAGVINGLGHYWGYRNYEPHDASANLSPIGLLIGGEELHNNHHAFPSSAKLSNKQWEFDIGWFYIRALEILNLAHVKKIAPIPRCIPGKVIIDLDTLRAVILNRFYVMADFSKLVIVPVLREELLRADGSQQRILKCARSLLISEKAYWVDQDYNQLNNVLNVSQSLRTVYEFRLSLQSVWNRATTHHDKLVASLQEWCEQADTSGIQSLRLFSRSLRGYTMHATV